MPPSKTVVFPFDLSYFLDQGYLIFSEEVREVPLVCPSETSWRDPITDTQSIRAQDVGKVHMRR